MKILLMSIIFLSVSVLGPSSWASNKSERSKVNLSVKGQDQEALDLGLLDASLQGDLNKVKEFLKNGANINAKNEEGETPLIIASRNGEIKIVKLILAYPETDVNIKGGSSGATALHYAVMSESGEIVKLLLAHPETDVNIKGGRRNGLASRHAAKEDTALHYAVMSESGEIVKSLLAHPEIDVNPKNSYGQTPLHVAAWDQKIENVKILLADGRANASAKDYDGSTPLYSTVFHH